MNDNETAIAEDKLSSLVYNLKIVIFGIKRCDRPGITDIMRNNFQRAVRVNVLLMKYCSLIYAYVRKATKRGKCRDGCVWTEAASFMLPGPCNRSVDH
jgi:hypothetical protein